MRKVVLGAVVVATAAVAVPAVGLLGSPDSPVLRPFTATADEGLPAFEDCEELLDWYVEKALPLVGPYGLGDGHYWPYLRGAMPEGGVAMEDGLSAPSAAFRSAKAAAPAAGNSATGTNVQEAGVDEPDGAKTDGKLIYRIESGRLIITDVTGAEPVELSSTKLPDELYANDLLLVGDTVVVVAQGQGGNWPRPMFDSYYAPMPQNSRVVTYDVSDPESPSLESDQEFEGTAVETRQYDDTVRVVLQTGFPELDFVTPTRRRDEQEATQANKDIVRESTIEDWLPSVVVDDERTPLVDCTDVRHPTTDSGFGTLSVVTFEAASPDERETVAVTTSGSLAYSSTDRLYVATPVQRDMPVDDGGWWPKRLAPPELAPSKTEVHQFDLDGLSTSYAASGVVDGSVRDRWSFDEYDGSLRVATALTRDWETTDNAITVLRAEDGKLERVGRVRGLGRREEIQSVRWFDDLAVIVTFRQMDPLYTVDLSDPASPKVLGELKIPGFSSYLHPLGDDLLLGLGTSATNDGRRTGGQVATFDISDLKDPRQEDVLKVDDASFVAAYDPRGFTFLPGTDKAFATMTRDYGGNQVVELTIGADGQLSEQARWWSREDTRVVPIDGGRVALVGRIIRLVQS